MTVFIERRRHKRTVVLDQQVIMLLREGISPKEVWFRLRLRSVWTVYNVIRRNRSFLPINSLAQNRHLA